MVLFLSLSVLSPAQAGVWVGTPVGVRLAPTSGFALTAGELATSKLALVPCSGTVTTVPVTAIDVVDPASDFTIPLGCWTELDILVEAVHVDTFAGNGEAFLSLRGLIVKVPLGDGPAPGMSLTLVVGQPGWLSPLAPWLDANPVYVDPWSPLHDPLLSGLAAGASL